jgi:alkanesulfonate monooxygenase SsuD/methylene tetrahydromethanopterin reductase-like flavin-dependent oxidoreductase (luciferase family)
VNPIPAADVTEYAARVKVFAALYGLTDAAERARELRDAGATGVASFEGPHDVFAPLTLAATVPGLDLLTNVAIAFPRNPIHLAHQANDHQLLSSGRFFLGLGTQVRTQIEKRFGAQFDQPVARMTELIAALRAIFAAWNTGKRLDFRGDYYRHTLMTPAFDPGPNPHGPPPIYVGALGPRLTCAVAGHADGLLVMPFGTKRFLHEHTLPAVRDGLATGRTGDQRVGYRARDHRVGRRHRRRAGKRRHPCAPTAGVLRFDTGLSAGAGRARLGGTAAGAQHVVQAGSLAGDGG